MTEFNNQATFNKSARGILTQAAKSGHADIDYPNGFFCAYREGELRCAAGWLIPDEKYIPEMENYSAASVRVGLVLESEGHDPVLANGLQRIHDREAVEDWPDELRNLAKNYDLSAAVVDELEPAFREKLAGGPSQS